MKKALEKKVIFYKELMADLIHEARLNAGLTQEELGKLIYRNQSHVARLEAGDFFPRIETLVKLSEALKCELILPTFSNVKKSFYHPTPQ